MRNTLTTRRALAALAPVLAAIGVLAGAGAVGAQSASEYASFRTHMGA
jgi:hypothetical protein